jgi:hypothetical protein
MHQSLQGASFHVEHIVPRSKGGAIELENLALACPACNLHKADRVEAFDHESRANVSLYHPRFDSWNDHFAFVGFEVTAKTDIGRATLQALDFNHERRMRIREVESVFGLFQPS